MIADLKAGAQIKGLVLLVSKKTTRQTKAKKDYWALTLRDKTGVIEGRAWDIPPSLDIKVDDFVTVSGEVDEYREELQIQIRTIDFVPESEVKLSDFLPAAAKPAQEMYDLLKSYIFTDISNEPLKALLKEIIESPSIKPGLLKAPAATMYHHAYTGGLLEHILSLWGAAKYVCLHYPKLDRDIILAACVLHDIGKVQELSYDRSFQYTAPGNLTGHVIIGTAIVMFAAQKLKTPGPIKLALLHLIASHHGDEFGAVKPQTREAVVFHHLDMIDSRLGGIERALEDDRDGEEFVRVPILGDKRMYRGKV